MGLSRVLDSESDAYWCFTYYILRVGFDFTSSGMLQKLDTLKNLLATLDVALVRHFEACGVDDMMFCHRWLILGFKREFNFEDGIRVFEILSSHHLELSSFEAERTYSEGRTKEAEKNETFTIHSRNPRFTFDIFLAVAMLIQRREDLFLSHDQMDVFQVVNEVEKRTSLDFILAKAEALFFNYCRKSVVTCFQVDVPKNTESIFAPLTYIANSVKNLL